MWDGSVALPEVCDGLKTKERVAGGEFDGFGEKCEGFHFFFFLKGSWMFVCVLLNVWVEGLLLLIMLTVKLFDKHQDDPNLDD